MKNTFRTSKVATLKYPTNLNWCKNFWNNNTISKPHSPYKVCENVYMAMSSCVQ